MAEKERRLGLRNPTHFPSFTRLPDYDSPWGRYYEEANGVLTKTMHWCLLATIKAVITQGTCRV